MLKKLIFATTVCAVALGCIAPVLAQGNANPGVLPVKSHAFGKTYAEWAAAWWQWALSFPLAVNPLFDTSGEFGSQGQSGPVWFLASSVGFGVWDRELTVPAGRALLIPLTHVVFWYPEDGETEADLRARANAAIDGVTILECTVDGVDLRNLFDYRTQTAAFTIPDDLIVDFGYAPGDRYPAVAAGYWLLLTPRPPGQHEIHWYMEFTSGEYGGNTHEVTYHLTVAGGSNAD